MHQARLQVFVFSFAGAGAAQLRCADDVPTVEHWPGTPRFIRHPAEIPLDYERVAAPAVGPCDPAHGGLRFDCRDSFVAGTVLDLCAVLFGERHGFRAQVLSARQGAGGHELTVGFGEAQDAFQARMVEQFCQIECYRRRVRLREGRELSPDAAAREWIERFAARFP